jgi:1,4-dihydroxy-2-naphthoate octaprenyltransferase
MLNATQSAEPALATLVNPWQRYFLATRPAFLTVTLFACLIGLASAFAGRVPIAPLPALATIVFALIAHAGINVFNDYYDALNGADAANAGRIYPYTGGSRFIQNGVLSERQTLTFAMALFAVVIAAGMWLTMVAGPDLFWIGLAGLGIGWAYSAPPLKLNSRGVGELCVAAGWMIVVIGADYVQRHAFSWLPAIASFSYALHVTNILYINQFPDREADAHAGKRHWVVRLGPGRARFGYVVIAIIAYVWLIAAVIVGALPWVTLLALFSAAPVIQAAGDVLRFAAQPKKLAPAIRATIAATALHGCLLSAALVVSRWM